MKIKTIAILLFIIGLLLLAGCASNEYTEPPTGSAGGGYVGGGCGVAGVPLNEENVNEPTVGLETGL